MSMTTKIESTNYVGTFRWGSGEADVPTTLTHDQHGWFCNSVNGQEWVYPAPFNPDGGWGCQFAERTALSAVRAFLKRWDACGSDGDGGIEECDPGVEPGTLCTSATKLTVSAVIDNE